MKRKSLLLFVIFNGIQIILLFLIVSQSMLNTPNYEAKKRLVENFLITDYCFSTESRHTRHYLFSDLIAPFQDFAGWHEHFPSSSFFPPPKLNRQKQ